MSGKIMKIEKTAVACLSNVLNGMDKKNLLQARLFFSAVSAFNPFDAEISGKITANLESRHNELLNQHIQDGGTQNNFELDRLTTLKDVIEEFFVSNPKHCSFIFDYHGFVDFWSKDIKNPLNSHTALKNAAKKLTTLNYSLEYEHKGKKIMESVGVCSKAVIKDTDEIRIVLNPYFMPYLVFISELFKIKGYTRIPVELFQGKTNESTFNMMAFLLKHFRRDGNKTQPLTFDIETFRKETGMTNKLKTFKDLRVKFIESALSEMDDDKIKVEVKYKKKGNKVTHIVFLVTSEYLLDSKSKKATKAIKKKTQKQSMVAYKDEKYPQKNKSKVGTEEEQMDFIDTLDNDGFLF